jgi:hypothetical protein
MATRKERGIIRSIVWLVPLASLVAGSAGAVAPNLTYRGGPVVSNAQIVMVNWNSSVPAYVQSGMPAFYSDIVRSDYWGILEEYSTATQRIRFGTFAQSYTITPVKTSSTLTDADVNTELANQISAGHLPTPSLDASGNVNTVFMVHFPSTISISLQGSLSCVAFCAYNSTFTSGTLKVGVGVIPEQGNGGQCKRACGGSTDFEAETLTSMSVLANVVTDPQVGVNVLSWYDDNNGELAFLCQSPAVTVPANGNTYAVFPLWSQHAGVCTSVGYVFRSGFDG